MAASPSTAIAPGDTLDADIARVARRCRIRLREPAELRFEPRRRRDCFATGTLSRLYARHGEEHLTLVLRLIVETRGNAGELYRDTIEAVSAVLASTPALLDRGVALYDAFDAVDLAQIRRHAKALASGMPVHQVMRVLIALKLGEAAEIGA